MCLDGSNHVSPEGGFSGVAVVLEGFGDLIESGFYDVVLRISGPGGVGFFGEGPTGPGSGFALLAAGFFEAICVVLEMDARIADEHVSRCVTHEPHHRGVGQGEFVENGFFACEVGAHGTIQTEEGAGG